MVSVSTVWFLAKGLAVIAQGFAFHIEETREVRNAVTNLGAQTHSRFCTSSCPMRQAIRGGSSPSSEIVLVLRICECIRVTLLARPLREKWNPGGPGYERLSHALMEASHDRRSRATLSICSARP